MDIQTQLRYAAKTIREGGVFDRGSVVGIMLRAAQDIDSLSFTVQQYRDEYESAARKQEHWTVEQCERHGQCHYCGLVTHLRIEPNGRQPACKTCCEQICHGENEPD